MIELTKIAISRYHQLIIIIVVEQVEQGTFTTLVFITTWEMANECSET